MKNGNPLRLLSIVFLAVVGGILLLNVLNGSQSGVGSALVGNATKRLTLTEFQKALKDGEIDAVKWQQETIRGEFVGSKERFEVRTPPATSEAGSRLSEEIQATGASLELVDPPAIQGILPFLGFLIGPLLIVGLIYFLFIRPQQAGGNQAMNFGRSRARRAGENTPKVTFDDVAGIDEAKEELFEIVDFLRNTKKYSQLGAKIPKGILLTGPPGVGKTHLARAIAGEAGVPFFHISGSDFVEMFVGVGAARVRDLFETAKAHRPCLIFIDEIDAVGRQRGAGLGGGHDEREQTLNQLLVEMDGFDANSGVIMIAATNRPDVLDPALLRPGRFDRQVVVDPPDVKGREMILNIHRKGKPIDAAVSMATVAKRTPGFTGADLANGLNEAALLAARRGHNTISQLDIDDALDRVMAGPERKSRVMDGTERRIIAYHEAGHALVGEKLEHADPVHKITILPRGMSLGSTWHLPEKDTYLHSEQSLHDRIATLLGGRVAEEIIFGSVTTGASNDLQRVTRIARAMVTEYGMSSRLGTMAIGRTHRNPFLGRDYDQDRDYSEEVARIIDEEVRKIVEHNRERAEQILQTNRRALDEIAQYLLDRETIDREGFLAILDGRSVSEKPASSDDDPAGGTQTPADDPSDLKPKFPAVPPKLEPGTA